MSDNFVRDKLIGFFEADVLSLYKNNPHKYDLGTDNFHGILKTTSTYFEELRLSERLHESIYIHFTYHSKKDGTSCIAVSLLDFKKTPEAEQRKWHPFMIDRSLLSPEDERFERWYDRYFQANIDGPMGTKAQLWSIIGKIDACCKTLVCEPLYMEGSNVSIDYPISQNSHAYEDAHKNLYGFLIDSLSKKCLLAFAVLRNKAIPQPENMRSKTLLRHVFDELDKHSKLHTLLSKVSEQRGRSSHGVRDPAIERDAFEDFNRDLEVATEGYEELLSLIESEFSVSADHELRRHEIMAGLPKLDEDKVIEPNFSICQATRMEGKTVEKVWFGMLEDSEGRHQSETLRVQFTDGEILAIDAGSNIKNIIDMATTKPNELVVDFILTWVPAPSNTKVT